MNAIWTMDRYERLAAAEQELARIKGAGLPAALAQIEKYHKHCEQTKAESDVAVARGYQAHRDRATLLDAVRALTAERDAVRANCKDATKALMEAALSAGPAADASRVQLSKARQERNAARAEVERLRTDNRQLAENAELATKALERRTQELLATEDALRIKTAEADTLRKNRDALAHGEAEALKMMGAEKRRADGLAVNSGLADIRIRQLQDQLKACETALESANASILKLRAEVEEQRGRAEDAERHCSELTTARNKQDEARALACYQRDEALAELAKLKGQQP